MSRYPSERQRLESRIAGLRLAGENGEADDLEADLPQSKLTLVDRDALGGAASTSRHAGSDAEAFLDADPALCDINTYGGRCCEICGSSLDSARPDAVACSSACRHQRWRKDLGDDLDAERNRNRPRRNTETKQS